MKKKSIIGLFIIMLIALCVWIGKSQTPDETPKEVSDSDVIENETYYQEKQAEFWKAEDKYNDVLTAYIEEKFSKEEKQILKYYNQKIAETSHNGKKDEAIGLSHQKIAYIEKVSEQKFSKEQLQNLEEIQKKIDDLEPIVDEYVEKQVALEEKQFWKGRETLKDGSVINVREAVISDKECDGWKFTNLSMRYLPEKKVTKFGATVTNVSDKVKKGKISVKITGDVETIFPLRIERLEPGEFYNFEVENGEDISMAGTLEIVPYNEKDYEM